MLSLAQCDVLNLKVSARVAFKMCLPGTNCCLQRVMYHAGTRTQASLLGELRIMFNITVGHLMIYTVGGSQNMIFKSSMCHVRLFDTPSRQGQGQGQLQL